jgi:hypothetical protein
MLEFKKPIPVILKETNELGYALYVVNSGMLENDVWAVILKNGGEIRHCLSNQIKIVKNKTFNII